MTQRDIKLKIQDKISDLIPELSKGRHIEIHLSNKVSIPSHFLY